MRPLTPDRRIVLHGLAAVAAGAAAPALADMLPPSFLALGDWGRGGDETQRAVAAALAQAADETRSRFVISVGDNFYPAGVASPDDAQWRRSFEAVYDQPSLQTPWYVALGNHDHRGRPDAQIAYAARSHRWRMPARHYQVAGAALGVPGMDLFVLDTTPMLPLHGEPIAEIARGRFPAVSCEAQLAWLAGELARSQAPWKVVVGHHPIRTGGRHGQPPELIARLEPLLAAHGVQVYLSGHDHVLQHIRHGPTDYVVTGSGAQAGPVHAITGTRFMASREGFAMFAVRAKVMTLEFRDSAGRTLYRADLPRERG